ncbi:MAG: PadR family transcriptional regulator [Candidatus Rokubacteria bacterium]|nr:PadR family transcriptional regulator [Candidatus Rokubacteria bacterium]
MPPATGTNTLRYALLGLLSRRRLSGWEILKRFSRSIVFFWHAKRSQIYAELRRMERLGLVSSRLEIRGGGPNPRHYAIADAGRAALDEWLDRPTPAAPVKDEMLLRTFFSERLEPDRVRKYLEEHGEEHRRVLEKFDAIRARLEERYGPVETTTDRGLFFGYLVLEQGIRLERMSMEWCRWAAAIVERRRDLPITTTPDADFIMTSVEGRHGNPRCGRATRDGGGAVGDGAESVAEAAEPQGGGTERHEPVHGERDPLPPAGDGQRSRRSSRPARRRRARARGRH